ncbi:MAG TPA: DNA-directed RNA polymerase subunit omega [Dictyoglomaceae bacterium]|nr:DNA-directed RNA polymerase subunit omega [Dictyoglomaceae bacterium]HOL39091.1 DNA-directed RNA polymerase subunit omega [Dictyoglomaceae bacterium]HOP94300.1 DNA-directed RNA polymerase subunit omega [Dictyoglomaceae bacterium]HPP15245.1 DNA-directed RNA polymerase subunit omega [Dictyoglomaceae bacterium]HPU42651.1 DNA-directed RNA polymerase subunit omega [Dictyoglomaceae bacterium]
MKEMTIDSLLEKVPNKYILTVTISKRARQIVEELKFLKAMAKDPIQLAMEEIIKDKITYDEGGDSED